MRALFLRVGPIAKPEAEPHGRFTSAQKPWCTVSSLVCRRGGREMSSDEEDSAVGYVEPELKPTDRPANPVIPPGAGVDSGVVEVFYPEDNVTKRHNLLVSGITRKSPKPNGNYMAKGLRWKIKK